MWNCESHFATEIRPVCAKMGVVGNGGGGGGGGGGNLTLGRFLKTTTHWRLTKKKKKKRVGGGGGRYYRFLCLTVAQCYWLVYCFRVVPDTN